MNARRQADVLEMEANTPSILIVDDDAVFRDRLSRAFQNRGFRALQADGYEAAVTVAKRECPDMAVVDLRMPGQSGLELVRDLKTMHSRIRIVVLTGYGSIGTAVEATRVGATYYLSKPADVDDVLSAFARGDAPPLANPPSDHAVPSLARAEWEHIQRVLADAGGSISEAARRLGLHRRTLQRKLHKYPPSS